MKIPPLKRLTDNSPLSQIVPELSPVPAELVIGTRQASAFFETELAGWLAFRRVDTVLVAGCTTSGCIRATIVDACSHNLRPIVVVDCVGDRALAPHAASLFDMQQKYADLTTSAEFVGRPKSGSGWASSPALPGSHRNRTCRSIPHMTTLHVLRRSYSAFLQPSMPAKRRLPRHCSLRSRRRTCCEAEERVGCDRPPHPFPAMNEPALPGRAATWHGPET
jgi:Isochorismatase family